MDIESFEHYDKLRSFVEQVDHSKISKESFLTLIELAHDIGFDEGEQKGFNDSLKENVVDLEEAEEMGYERGWDNAYAELRDEIYQEAFSEGRREGWDEGNESGYEKGYQNGFEDAKDEFQRERSV